MKIKNHENTCNQQIEEYNQHQQIIQNDQEQFQKLNGINNGPVSPEDNIVIDQPIQSIERIQTIIGEQSIERRKSLLQSNTGRRKGLVIQEDQAILKRPIYFTCKTLNAALINLMLAYQLVILNPLIYYLPKILKWSEDEELQHFTNINTIPQILAGITSLFAGKICAILGCRKFLILSCLIMVAGSLLLLAQTTVTFYIGRIIIGLSLGIWSCIGPQYSSEIAPKPYRGICGIIFSLFFGFGVLSPFLLSLNLNPDYTVPDEWWKFMVVWFPIILGGLFIVLQMTVFRFDTPQHIIISTVPLKDENEIEEQLQIAYDQLTDIYEQAIAQEEFDALQALRNQILSSISNKITTKELFFNIKYRYRTFLIFFVTLFYHLTCDNGINIYSYLIIAEHSTPKIATQFNLFMAIADIIGPFFALYFLEKLGRKVVLQLGQAGCILNYLIFCISGWFQYYDIQKYNIVMHRFFFSGSVAPVHTVYIPEIAPVEALGLWGFAFWIISFIVVQIIQALVVAIKFEGTFFVFTMASLVMFILAFFFFVDVTGISRDEIDYLFLDLAQRNEKVIVPQNNLPASNLEIQQIYSKNEIEEQVTAQNELIKIQPNN